MLKTFILLIFNYCYYLDYKKKLRKNFLYASTKPYDEYENSEVKEKDTSMTSSDQSYPVIVAPTIYDNYPVMKIAEKVKKLIEEEKARVAEIEAEEARKKAEYDAQREAELEAAPSLKTFEYQAWDEPTREFVNSVIKMYLNPGDAMEKVLNETPTPSATKTPVAGSSSNNSNESVSIFFFLFFKDL